MKTIADQLTREGLKWKGYMEDMGNDPTRESGLCGRPRLNTRDKTQTATATDQYAARHNPFVYFHSIIDDNYYCEQHDVPLTQLPGDLSKARNTPSFSFITPDLCHDGHDEPCANGEPGGLVSADALLREWVPRITGLARVQARRPAADHVRRGRGRGRRSRRERVLQRGAVPEHAEQRRPHAGHGRRAGRGRGAVALHPAGERSRATPYNHFSRCARWRVCSAFRSWATRHRPTRAASAPTSSPVAGSPAYGSRRVVTVRTCLASGY